MGSIVMIGNIRKWELKKKNRLKYLNDRFYLGKFIENIHMYMK